MAGDWIKMRRGLRHDPKVVAMARYLSERRPFMNWWTDPQQQSADRNVTEYVTFANVTRVTVCALLDVWASLNNALKDDGHAPFMTLEDLDEIAEIPCFGEAMESVGWVTLEESGGLVFPNFIENNTPSKSRTGGAKSDAQRAKEYRARKKAERESQESVDASRHVTTEKRREEYSIERERARGEKAQTIVSAYPRQEKLASALRIVDQHLAEGENFEAMLSGTKAAAAVIRTLPSGARNRYVPSAESFFLQKRWQDDPETFKRQGDARGQSQPLSDEEVDELLGGRQSATTPTK